MEKFKKFAARRKWKVRSLQISINFQFSLFTKNLKIRTEKTAVIFISFRLFQESVWIGKTKQCSLKNIVFVA